MLSVEVTLKIGKVDWYSSYWFRNKFGKLFVCCIFFGQTVLLLFSRVFRI